MTILLKNIGKKFNQQWVFRNINYEFTSQNKYAIVGSNGSGKSTLLQMIAGYNRSTEGEITYPVPPDELVKNLAYAAPYLELPEEMTWNEAIAFHHQFKPFFPELNKKAVLELSGLAPAANKPINYFSSGMKQRAKLCLAILSNTPLLLLDEPTSNLDAHAIQWYHSLIHQFGEKRTILVCSNYNKEEYAFCNNELVISKK
jgi:ABC-type multidrug transport system ATPase subunit